MSASSPPSWPKTYSPKEAPGEVLDLTARLMALLLAGGHPTNAVLRAQYERSRIRKVELTGVGFFVEFEIPFDVAPTAPTSFAGVAATIEVEGVRNPAGVSSSSRMRYLSKLEGYAYGWDAWA